MKGFVVPVRLRVVHGSAATAAPVRARQAMADAPATADARRPV